MSDGKAIALNSFWMIGGKVLTTILSLVLTASLARALGVYGFGEFTTVFAFLNFFGVIADFGFFQILVRELSARPAEETKITNDVFTLRTMFGALIYGLGTAIVWLLPYGPTVRVGVLILAVASFLLSINTTLVGVFQARHEMIKSVVGDVVSRFLLLTLVLAYLHRGVGLPHIFWLYAIANLVNLLITVGYILARLPLRFQIHLPSWRLLFREAWPLGVVTMLGIIYFKIDTVILSLLRGPTDVGIYGAPYKIFELLTIVPAIFMGNVFPVITRYLTDETRLKRLIQTAFDTLMIGVIGMMGGLVVLARAIIGIVAGPDFLSAHTISIAGHPITAVTILVILSLALFTIFLGQLWSPIVIASGHQRDLIKPGVYAVILNVVLNFIFIPRGSYLAASITTILTEVFIAISWGRIAFRYIPMRLNLRRSWVGLAAALVMTIVIWPLRNSFILLPIVLGGSIYLGLLWLWGAIPAQAFVYLGLKKATL